MNDIFECNHPIKDDKDLQNIAFDWPDTEPVANIHIDPNKATAKSNQTEGNGVIGCKRDHNLRSLDACSYLDLLARKT